MPDRGAPLWTAPAPTAAAGPADGDGHRRALAIGGGVLAIVGVVAAVVLWLVADRRHQSTIEEFARAPAGCDTTLAFESDGRYLLYLETSGVVEPTTGDCAVRGTFDRLDSTPPAFEVAVVGDDGDAVALAGHTPISYDIDGFTGASVGSLEIDAAGEYVIRVASTDDDFVVAVGPDPDGGAATLRLVAISVLIAGMVVGGTGLVLAARGGHARPSSTRGPTIPARPVDHRSPPREWEPARPLSVTEPPRTGPGAIDRFAGEEDPASRGVPGEALHPPTGTPWGPPTDRQPDRSGPAEDQ